MRSAYGYVLPRSLPVNANALLGYQLHAGLPKHSPIQEPGEQYKRTWFSRLIA